MQRKAFDGRVVFEVTGPTLRAIVVRQGFVAAIPECRLFKGDALAIFANVIEFMSHTKAIITDVEETDPDILALAKFWEFAKGNADYRAVWESFLDDIPTVRIHDEWVKALNEDETLKAPEELQFDAPDNESIDVEKKSVEMTT